MVGGCPLGGQGRSVQSRSARSRAATVVKALTGGAAGKLIDLDTVKRDVRSIIVDGDRAVVQQHLTATTRNGNDYANEYCWVYTCRDGKVSVLEEYADTLHAGRVFGWIKD